MEARRAALGPVLSPFGSLAMITFVDGMCRVSCSLVWCCFVRRLFQFFSLISHNGARCLSILLEYCIGLHCYRTVLSCSFVPICPYIEARFSGRALSTAIDASRMLVVMSVS